MRRLSTILIGLVFLLGSIVSNAPLAHAEPTPFDLARDTVSSLHPDLSHVVHEFYFTLPATAVQISPSEWLTVKMPQFTIENPPSTVIGSYTDPVITQVSSTEFKITNLSILSGTGLTISGLTAKNPPFMNGWPITISLSSDQAGTNVRLKSEIIPTDGDGYVAVSAYILSALSALSVSGVTSPNSFVTLVEDTSVLGTTVSDGLGNFLFSFTGLTPGAHSYSITGTDSNGRTTSRSTLNLYLLANTLTTATGLLLSPTIEIDQTEINPGDAITVSGSAKPNSQINIFLEAPLRTYTVNTDGNGAWSYTVPASVTNDLAPGQYQFYTLVQDSIGNQSIVSPTAVFTVRTPPDNNPPPACDISHGDLNCDGRTNLTDFSILLYHWQTNHKVADINGDGKVNLTDFSIMMFYFAR